MDVEVVRRTLWRRWRLLVAAGVLIGAYAAAGFLLVSYLARSAIEKYVTQDLKRHIAIGKITFNPFSLTTQIHSLALSEAGNSPIASFAFLEVNFQISSVVFRAWTFEEIRLE